MTRNLERLTRTVTCGHFGAQLIPRWDN